MPPETSYRATDEHADRVDGDADFTDSDAAAADSATDFVDRAADADDDARSGPTEPHDAEPIQREAIHVRNYDVHASHTVAITVLDTAGRPVFESRYHLRPGQTESERGVLSPGTYTVRVRCDGIARECETCRVGPHPSRTAVVELGNGAVSVSEGLY